jgi:cell division septation protein DedD
MTDDEPRGVHLSDKQLVFVFMSATVAAVVVFLFGVFVGRGVQQARGPMAGDGMSAAIEVVPDGAAGEAPPADGAPPAGSAGGVTTPLSYPERLGKTPPAERLTPAPADDRPTDGAPPEVPDEPLGPASASSTPSLLPPAPPPAEVQAEATYKVQVAWVRRREDAEAAVSWLKAKGYDAYVFVPPGNDNSGGFRVRIGSFNDKRQANMLAERLSREQKRYKPWVTR